MNNYYYIYMIIYVYIHICIYVYMYICMFMGCCPTLSDNLRCCSGPFTLTHPTLTYSKTKTMVSFYSVLFPSHEGILIS